MTKRFEKFNPLMAAGYFMLVWYPRLAIEQRLCSRAGTLGAWCRLVSCVLFCVGEGTGGPLDLSYQYLVCIIPVLFIHALNSTGVPVCIYQVTL